MSFGGCCLRARTDCPTLWGEKNKFLLWCVNFPYERIDGVKSMYNSRGDQSLTARERDSPDVAAATVAEKLVFFFVCTARHMYVQNSIKSPHPAMADGKF